MKKLTLLFLLFAKLGFAQQLNDKVVYLDSLFVETYKDDYKYYKIIKDYHLDKSEYLVTQYYKTGNIESQGLSTNKDFFYKNGEIISFYENGNKKEQINYVENIPNGKCEFWYENGNKKLEGEYLSTGNENPTFKINNYWDIDNVQKVIDGNGDYTDDQNFDNHIGNSSTISKGKVKNGFKDGIWVGSNKKEKFTFEENYQNEEFVSGSSIDENNIKHDYNVIALKPMIKGGMTTFYKFVAKNFKVPDDLKVNGKVIVQFIIDVDGKITNLKVVKSLQKEADDEAVRVIEKFESFSPAEIRGIKVKCIYYLPISLQVN